MPPRKSKRLPLRHEDMKNETIGAMARRGAEMIEKLRTALQSIDLTQITIAAAGGLGGAALWAQKRYKWFAQWRAKRLKRRSAVRELPERVAGFALTMAALGFPEPWRFGPNGAASALKRWCRATTRTPAHAGFTSGRGD